MAKKNVVLGNRKLTGEVVGFKIEDEPWCQYQLEDGTKLRIRLVLSEVIRVDGAYTLEGDPLYVARSSNVIATVVPEALRRTDQPAGGTNVQ